MADVLSNLDLAALTDVGLKRKQNEDSFRMFVPPPGSREAALGAVFFVADGMGGLGGGDVASKSALDEFARVYYSSDTVDFEDRLDDALESANVFVREQAPRVGLMRIGSTGAGMVLRPSGEAVIFNVGDCRVYRIRGSSIDRVSRDQSVMERQLEAGMSEDDVKATRSSMVTAFIGQPLPLKPVLSRDKVQPGDVYIICSDGLWGLVDYKEIMATVKGTPAHIAAKKLIDLALKRGGNDNITVIIVRIGAAPSNGGLVVPLLLAGLVGAIGIGIAALTGGAVNNTAPSATDTPSAVATTAAPTQPPTESPTDAPTDLPTDLPTTAVSPAGIATTAETAPTNADSATDSPNVAGTSLAPQTQGTSDSGGLIVAATFTSTITQTSTPTVTPSVTNTASRTPRNTYTATKTASITPTPSDTATITPSITKSPTYTVTPSLTPSFTETPTATLTATLTRTPTPTLTRTPTPSATNTPRPRPRATNTPSEGGEGSFGSLAETIIAPATP